MYLTGRRSREGCRLETRVFLRIALIAAAICSTLTAQNVASTQDGVYSAAQATRGEALYGQQCRSCHGATLEGSGQTPPLAGDEFIGNWKGMPLVDLFDKMQASMPADKPGSLSRAQNADVLAFILKANKMPTGQGDLRDDGGSLKNIHFEPAKAK